MTFAIVTSATAAAAVAAAALAGPALARSPEIEVRHAVARVVVIVEDRTDVGVEIEQGRSTLPPLELRRRGDQIRIDGGLARGRVLGLRVGGNRIGSCRSGPADARQPGEGASVEVGSLGRINVADAPLIVIRTPRSVDLSVGGAVYGAVGRGATAIELGNSGCGDWTVANTEDLSISMAGSGSVRAGTSARLDVSVAGSGEVRAGATRNLDVSVAGSGDVWVAEVNGPVDVSIAGSGDVTVAGGQVGAVDVSIAGSGDVDIRATAASVDASIMGSGDVHIAGVTGTVERSIMGSGSVTVGERTYER
ncbi:DUF2807 domain-containing protein [uncultured Brevundimonas sp.]|uniref:GIN domain-containing protein n=1 Tax=uncultured Brevundimonas sp. TaxID=213418 RepID=UPI0030EBD502|tara:strand:- start:1136 stop:2056 length:921 start_codon:yes stop_codon:yes gene_type:complete